jgi:hypothetical protein
MRIIMWARQKRFAFQIRPVLRCQHMAARQILIRKYGVTPMNGTLGGDEAEQWQAWLTVLGKTPVGLREAFLVTRTFLSCGLAEITALFLEPTLRNSYFIAISGVLLTAGFFQSVSLIRRQREPLRQSLTHLRFLMEELAEMSPASTKEEKGARTGSGVTVSADVNNDTT